MDENKLKAIGDAMFQRFNLGDPETADLKTALKALIISDLTAPILLACRILGPKELTDMLRTFADGFELLEKEEKNEKTS